MHFPASGLSVHCWVIVHPGTKCMWLVVWVDVANSSSCF